MCLFFRCCPLCGSSSSEGKIFKFVKAQGLHFRSEKEHFPDKKCSDDLSVNDNLNQCFLLQNKSGKKRQY